MPVMGYWSLRGYAQYIRLLLAYVEEEYEEKRYHIKPGANPSSEEWKNDKFSLGLDFPNLPYYMDDKVKITQSMAIMQYLGRKYDLDVTGGEDALTGRDMLLHEALDLRGGFTRLAYGEDFEKNKPTYVTDTAHLRFKNLEKNLGDKTWFFGDKLTFLDFIFYELFSHHQLMEPTILDTFPKLSAFVQRFGALPKIKKYLETSGTAKLPITDPSGRFGTKTE